MSVSCHSNPAKSSTIVSAPVVNHPESTWTGWAKGAIKGGRLLLDRTLNSSTIEAVCTRASELGVGIVMDAIVLSNWRRERMKRQTRMDVILNSSRGSH